LDSHFNLVYKYEFSGTEKNEDELKEDNLKFISPRTHTIDIKSDVRDYLLLSIPMKKAPEEVDGVCSYCKRNVSDLLSGPGQKSENPIWEELKKLKK
jgi:uncharacterized metal-binding protein YceD (DUF177 family)